MDERQATLARVEEFFEAVDELLARIEGLPVVGDHVHYRDLELVASQADRVSECRRSAYADIVSALHNTT